MLEAEGSLTLRSSESLYKNLPIMSPKDAHKGVSATGLLLDVLESS